MELTDTIKRLREGNEDNWAIHKLARNLAADGHDIIDLTIGEPDALTPDYLVNTTIASLKAGRTGYSLGAGEVALRSALAERYTKSSGRSISSNQVLCFPGTQTALYAVMRAVAEAGDEVLVGDPMYATYDAVISASGAKTKPVPLRAEKGFRLRAEDVERRITPASKVLFLNSPHNPTGAVLSRRDIEDLGHLAERHNLCVLADEVYEELVFGDVPFSSPLSQPELSERVIVVSSISKSHAAPGFRSGWCVGPEEFCKHLLPLSEAMLFGNQPFIADATASAISSPSPVAKDMCERFSARADLLASLLHSQTRLRVHRPDAGMFALVDVSMTGLDGEEFAQGLLLRAGVGVMPGASFGDTLRDWVRISLTKPDEVFDAACKRIRDHVVSLGL